MCRLSTPGIVIHRHRVVIDATHCLQGIPEMLGTVEIRGSHTQENPVMPVIYVIHATSGRLSCYAQIGQRGPRGTIGLIDMIDRIDLSDQRDPIDCQIMDGQPIDEHRSLHLVSQSVRQSGIDRLGQSQRHAGMTMDHHLRERVGRQENRGLLDPAVVMTAGYRVTSIWRPRHRQVARPRNRTRKGHLTSRIRCSSRIQIIVLTSSILGEQL